MTPEEIIDMALRSGSNMVNNSKQRNMGLLAERASQAPTDVGVFGRPSLTGVDEHQGTTHDGDLGDGDDQKSPSGMNVQFERALNQMIGASGGKITLTSGFRDAAKQQALWEGALKKYGDPEIADNWVARPGTSNHEKGNAGDLRFADDSTRKWAHENAGKYGLMFPLGNEPWHIEPYKNRK